MGLFDALVKDKLINTYKEIKGLYEKEARNGESIRSDILAKTHDINLVDIAVKYAGNEDGTWGKIRRTTSCGFYYDEDEGALILYVYGKDRCKNEHEFIVKEYDDNPGQYLVTLD